MQAYYEKENDLYSTRYINEIRVFLYDYRTIIDKLKIDEIPLLCPNVFNQLTRTGFISSGFGIEERIDLLKKYFIMELELIWKDSKLINLIYWFGII